MQWRYYYDLVSIYNIYSNHRSSIYINTTINKATCAHIAFLCPIFMPGTLHMHARAMPARFLQSWRSTRTAELLAIDWWSSHELEELRQRRFHAMCGLVLGPAEERVEHAHVDLDGVLERVCRCATP